MKRLPCFPNALYDLIFFSSLPDEQHDLESRLNPSILCIWSTGAKNTRLLESRCSRRRAGSPQEAHRELGSSAGCVSPCQVKLFSPRVAALFLYQDSHSAPPASRASHNHSTTVRGGFISPSFNSAEESVHFSSVEF